MCPFFTHCGGKSGGRVDSVAVVCGGVASSRGTVVQGSEVEGESAAKPKTPPQVEGNPTAKLKTPRTGGR